MKLKKNLIFTTILAISVFVSSTSYAADKQKSEIKIDEEKLNNLVEKVNEDTIITDVSLPKDGASGKGDSKTEENKAVEENPKDPKAEENKALDKKAEEESSDLDKKPQDETKEKTLKDSENNPNDKEIKKENVEENQVKEDSIQESNPKPNTSLPNNDKTNANINSNDTSNLEFMDRLTNIQSQEVKKPYINNDKSKTASLERLTSKQTLTTSFDDKGSNLRLNLANTSDGILDSRDERFRVKPQTLIILIAILAAILSSISIAIRGNKFSKKQS